MSKILCGMVTIKLPDWEEVQKFINDPCCKSKQLATGAFLKGKTLYTLIVSENIVFILSKDINEMTWTSVSEFAPTQEGYEAACNAFTNIFSGEIDF